MKARRQIVDPLTGGKVSPDSPAAIDTGRVVVGRNTVVPTEDLDPAGDRFGVAAEAVPELRRKIAESKKAPRQKLGRGAGVQVAMTSPTAGLAELEQLNPTFFQAIEGADLRDTTHEFMDRIEVRRGKKHVPLSKTAAGQRILDAGASRGAAGGPIARGMLKYLLARARGGKWRDVPWDDVINYTEAVVGALDEPTPGLTVPIAAGRDSPDVMIARAREELGPAAAAKVVRQMNAEELGALAERLEAALATVGEECLTGDALKVARERLRQIRAWRRRPDQVPPWSCVGSEHSLGAACAFPGLLEDIERIERACEVEYDPRWPVERAERACADGEEEDRTGIIGEPCAVKSAPREAPKRAEYRMVMGRLVKV